jgi:ribonuclease HII
MITPVRGATHIYLDGLLHAPLEYSQKTVIHGDALIPIISLASVIAKVSRDALMAEMALDYPQYGFEQHKGYGTRAHYAALAAHGPSAIHRTSFLARQGAYGVG